MVVWRSYVCIRYKPVVILGIMIIRQYCKLFISALVLIHLKTLG